MKKSLFIVAIVVVVAAMAASYFYFKQQQNTAVSAIDAVPVNSAAIIEVKDARAVLKSRLTVCLPMWPKWVRELNLQPMCWRSTRC